MAVGAAYVYDRNQGGADNWGQVQKLTASDGVVSDGFGFSVAISGDTVVVGAYGHNMATGAAYVYERDQGGPDNWGQVQKLTASDGAAQDAFGDAIAISGDAVVVGAPDNAGTGAAYVFARNQGGADNWGQVQKLTASDAAANDLFGVVVGISVDAIVVGAPGKNSFTGAAYTYGRNQGGAGNWGQIQKLTSSAIAPGDEFGAAVGIDGDTTVSGAPGKNAITGAAYTFNNACGQWVQARQTTASDAAGADLFGLSAA